MIICHLIFNSLVWSCWLWTSASSSYNITDTFSWADTSLVHRCISQTHAHLIFFFTQIYTSHDWTYFSDTFCGMGITMFLPNILSCGLLPIVFLPHNLMNVFFDSYHIFFFSGGNTTQSGKKQTSTIILTPPPGVATNLVGVSCESCYGE